MFGNHIYHEAANGHDIFSYRVKMEEKAHLYEPQGWLNFLLQLTNLINTLSPLDFLRRLLRFNELNLEVPMDQYGHGNYSRLLQNKKLQKTYCVAEDELKFFSECGALWIESNKKETIFASTTEK